MLRLFTGPAGMLLTVSLGAAPTAIGLLVSFLSIP